MASSINTISNINLIFLEDNDLDTHSFDPWTFIVIGGNKLNRNELISFIQNHDAEKKELLNLFILDTIKRNDCEAFKFILKCGYRFEVMNDKGQTALHLAFYHNSHAILALLEKDDFCKIIDRDFTDCNGLTHFHIACARGHTNLVKKLLEYTPDVNARFETDPNDFRNGFTPLHFAAVNCTRYREQIVQLLIEKDSNVHAIDSLGRTAFHWACKVYDHPRSSPKVESSLKVMQLIVETYKSDVNVKDANGNTPLLSIFPKKYNEFNTYYLPESHESNFIDETRKKFHFLLKHGADVTVSNKDGNNVLHLILLILRRSRYTPSNDLRRVCDWYGVLDKNFIEFSHFDVHYEKMITKVLQREQKVNVNAENRFGQTPLKLAVASMNIKIVKLLVRYKADVRNLKFDENNFFCYLSIVPNYDVVKNLLNILKLLESYGLDISLEDNLQVLKFLIHSHTDCECGNLNSDLSQCNMTNLLCAGSQKHIKYIIQKLYDDRKLETNDYCLYTLGLGNIKYYLDVVDAAKISINKEVRKLAWQLITEEISPREFSRHFGDDYSNGEASRIEKVVLTGNLKLTDVLMKDPGDIPYHIVNNYFSRELVHPFNRCNQAIRGHMAKSLVRYYTVKSGEDYFGVLLGFYLPQLLYKKIVYFLDNEDVLNMCLATVITNVDNEM